MSLVISDSTTIITLINIDRLDVLSNIFSRVYIPKKVHEEISKRERIVLNRDFFVTKEIKDKKLYKILHKSLDEGECEAIVLAKEMELSLIIDEKKGRKIANSLGINIFGFIGLLVLNFKRKKLLKDDVTDIFFKAKEQGFRVSSSLEKDFLDLIQ